MEQEKYVTKEYFNKQFKEFRSDFHIFTQVLQENFRSDLQVALDQVKSVTDKTDGHELRICKIEKAVL